MHLKSQCGRRCCRSGKGDSTQRINKIKILFLYEGWTLQKKGYSRKKSRKMAGQKRRAPLRQIAECREFNGREQVNYLLNGRKCVKIF